MATHFSVLAWLQSMRLQRVRHDWACACTHTHTVILLPWSIMVSNHIFAPVTIVTKFSSVTQSCPTVCDPMDCSIPGFSITNSRSLLKLMSIESVMPSSHLSLCRPLLLLPSIFPSVRVFSKKSQFFASGGQSIGALVSVSVLPINVQDWFPLGLTGLILQSKGLSRAFSNPTVQKHQSLSKEL